MNVDFMKVSICRKAEIYTPPAPMDKPPLVTMPILTCMKVYRKMFLNKRLLTSNSCRMRCGVLHSTG